MTFGSPVMLTLLLLVPIAVAGYVRTQRRQRARAEALAQDGLVVSSASTRPSRRHGIPFVLFATALAVLVVATARPMMTVRTPRREGTVILALDASNSMNADDLEPTRMEAAKAAARRFVDQQAPAVRIGVVAFGDGAVVVQEPTVTHPDAVAAIGRVSVGGGTSVGQGLLAALGAIAGKPITIDPAELARDSGEIDIGFFGAATIVLFSDGEETSNLNPVTVAEVASLAGVRVHTVGIGTEAGAVMAIEGFNVATALDRGLLETVARTADGTFHTAGDPAALAAITDSIDLRFKVVDEHTEVTGLLSGIGLFLLLAGAALSIAWFGRVLR